MDLKRIVRHLATTDRQRKRAFGPGTLAVIEQAIKAGEMLHTGEIRFVVEAALDIWPLLQGQSPGDRALELFSHLRIWDTEHNNGILIYLLLADRDVEIVADRGIHARVETGGWEKICRLMESAFKQGTYETGVLDGIEAVTRHLCVHFPVAGRDGANELPDAPLVL